MEAHSLTSFICGAAAFVLLCFGLVSKRLPKQVANSLGIASLLMVLWSASHSALALAPASNPLPLLISEFLRNGAWFAFLLLSLKKSRHLKLLSSLSLFFLLVSLVWVLTHNLTGLSTPTSIPDTMLGAAPAGQLPISTTGVFASTLGWYGMLIPPLIGLLLLEQIYRNTLHELVDGLRLIYISLGALFCFDLYYYVDSILLGSEDSTLAATRGAVAAIAALLMFFGIQRLRNDRIQLQVSREFILYSSGALAGAIFLVSVFIVGLYLRQYLGTWSGLLQTLLLFSAVVLCIILLSSPKYRATLKVLISKHFFKYRYDYREEWLRLTSILATSQVSQDVGKLEVIMAVARIFNAKNAALWLVHDNKVFINDAEQGFASFKAQELNTDHSLITFMQESKKIVVPEEYQKFPAHYPGLEIPAWLNVDEVWLIIPLIAHDSVIGFVTLSPPAGNRKLSWEDFDLLKTVGLQIASFLATEQASMKSAESKQFDAYSRLTAFIMHDLKNLIAQQSLVVKNAAKHKDNPEFIEDAISTIDNSVKRMSHLLDQLRHDGEQDKNTTIVCLQTVLQDAVRKCLNKEPRPSLHSFDKELYVTASNEQLSMILGHVIRNAQEATASSGFIDVTLSADLQKGIATIEIEDNGIGMSQEFIRSRLFRPFDSTKSNQGMGIGAYQTREFIRQAGGDVEIFSEENVGTTFRITLPLSEVADDAPNRIDSDIKLDHPGGP